ncbi:MAG: GMC family oxidoreductase [Deltaproteobacteria bacterium]|nr:GMC family oxidoreductase [Deltaproteobacteria bacterium]
MADAETYDYIVLGGGSAGSMAAAELARDPRSGCACWRAGDAAERNPEVLRADGYQQAFLNERLMWDRFTPPQPALGGARVFVGTGRGMGGSGSINAMVYTRGAAHDYDGWNVPGWSWGDVAPVFDEIERTLTPSRREPTRFTEACIAAAETQGFRRKEDLNDGALAGYLGYEWMNYRGNERRSSYVAFLKPLLGSPNLRVEAGARVDRIVFGAGRRAVAVEATVDGAPRRFGLCLGGEVLVASGALETPRILERSGVGRGHELRAHGIPEVAAVAGVGENLHDHPNVPLFVWGRQATDCKYVQLYGFHRSNPELALPPGEADTCFVFYTARSSIREAAVKLGPTKILPPALFAKPWARHAARGLLGAVMASPPASYVLGRMYGVIVILGKPFSRGRVRLSSADPAAPGIVDPGYLSDPRDMDTLVRGVEWARRIVSSEPLEPWGSTPVSFAARSPERARIESFVRANLITTYHFAGSCRMGEDAAAPADPRLALRGVEGVRIADASVIPMTPVSALNAPSMLIGFRAAGFALASRGSAP